MPWYGMHLIDRVRNQAIETDRSQQHLAQNEAKQPTRTELLMNAGPTLVVIALWAMVAAVLYCAATGTREWDIVMTVVAGPLLMLVAGLSWGSHKRRFGSGLDAAIVTGTAVGVLFALAALV